ncbi:MAG: hypothetical protein FIB07_09150 [Candidatus Methanoperedens sp.]|nr:hypothetical protein [Candidatus Methanoperedens sp.]
MVDQAEIHRLAQSRDVKDRKKAIEELNDNFSILKSKEQAWDDLIRLTRDNSDDVRRGATIALSICCSHLPEEYRKQAWGDIHRLTKNKEYFVRTRAANALGTFYSRLPEEYRKQAWNDLHRLTRDKEYFVRSGASRALGSCYSYIPEKYKKQAWDDLIGLLQANYPDVRSGAANALGFCYSQIPKKCKKQAWDCLHKLTRDNDYEVRSGVANALGFCYSHLPEEYKIQALDDLQRLTQDDMVGVRSGAVKSFDFCYSHLPEEYKKQVWNDLHRLTQDEYDIVRRDAGRFLVSCYSQIPEECRKEAWGDLIRFTHDNDPFVYSEAAIALGSCYPQIPEEYKQQAWDKLIELTQDDNDFVRMRAADALGSCYSCIPEEYRKQAWNDLHRFTLDNNDTMQNGAAASLADHEIIRQSIDNYVPSSIACALGSCYSYIPEECKKQAWEDLQRLAHDNYEGVRMRAADALGSCYSCIPEKYKEQAWDELIGLTQDSNFQVRGYAAKALSSCYSHTPYEYRKKAWNDIKRLTQDKDPFVRGGAAKALGTCYSLIPEEYRKQAWDDLQRLRQDNYYFVRIDSCRGLGSCYSQIPGEYRKQVWDWLQMLTHDPEKDVRIAANHSSGEVSIYRAIQAKNEESIKKELESALKFFEKASSESKYLNPARFCLPFYLSYYTIVFKEGDAKVEVEKYLAEAEGALEGSKIKEKLLKAVENLGNALKELRRARDSNEIKSDIKAYKQYIDRACEILEAIEEKAPRAKELIRKGLPIIDKKIKELLGEIEEKTKKLHEVSQGTPFEKISNSANVHVEGLGDTKKPIEADRVLNNLITDVRATFDILLPKESGRYSQLENADLLDKAMAMKAMVISISVEINNMKEKLAEKDKQIEYLEDKVLLKLDNLSYGISMLKLRSGEIVPSLHEIQNEMNKLKTIQADLNKIGLSLNDIENRQHQGFNRLDVDITRLANEIEAQIIPKLPQNNDATKEILKKLEDLKVPKKEVWFNRVVGLASIISLILPFL